MSARAFNQATDPNDLVNKLFSLEQRVKDLENSTLEVNRLDEITPSAGVLYAMLGSALDGTLIARRLHHVNGADAFSSTQTLPTGLLVEDNTLCIELTGSLFQNSAASRDITFEIKVGLVASEVTVTSATGVTITSGTTQRGWKYSARISRAPRWGTWVLCWEELRVDGVSLMERTSITNITGVTALDEINSVIIGHTEVQQALWIVYTNDLNIWVEEGLTQSDEVTWWSQPIGADSADTFILSTTATTNYSSNVKMLIGEDNTAVSKVGRALIKFDWSALSEVIDQYDITAAYLHLRISADLSSNARTLYVGRLLRDWVLAQATWNEYSTGNAWATAGAGSIGSDYTGTLATYSIGASETVGKLIVIDLTGKVGLLSMIDGTYSNYGLLVFMDVETNDAYEFHSGDAANPQNAPIIEIRLRRKQ